MPVKKGKARQGLETVSRAGRMYANKAFELVKELERTKGGNLPPFDVSQF